MYRVFINISKSGNGFFYLERKSETVGKIKFSLVNNELVLLDTIVIARRYINVIGKKLVNEIVGYARMHWLKIITVSKFVQKWFSNKASQYADVWERA